MKSITPTFYEALILLETLQSYAESKPCASTDIALNIRNEIMNNIPRIVHSKQQYDLSLDLDRIDVIDNALIEFEEYNEIEESIFNSCLPEVEHNFLGTIGANIASLTDATINDIYCSLSERVNGHREYFLLN